jgi:hypothetical protein
MICYVPLDVFAREEFLALSSACDTDSRRDLVSGSVDELGAISLCRSLFAFLCRKMAKTSLPLL